MQTHDDFATTKTYPEALLLLLPLLLLLLLPLLLLLMLLLVFSCFQHFWLNSSVSTGGRLSTCWDARKLNRFSNVSNKIKQEYKSMNQSV